MCDRAQLCWWCLQSGKGAETCSLKGGGVLVVWQRPGGGVGAAARRAGREGQEAGKCEEGRADPRVKGKSGRPVLGGTGRQGRSAWVGREIKSSCEG